jgi:hypothetical protein
MLSKLILCPKLHECGYIDDKIIDHNDIRGGLVRVNWYTQKSILDKRCPMLVALAQVLGGISKYKNVI